MEYQHPHTISKPEGFEIISVRSRKVACDGDGGVLGHPRVFLKIEHDDNSVTCPYCSRTYLLEA